MKRLLYTLFTLFPFALVANDAPLIMIGNTVVPIISKQVSMVSEKIEVDLYEDKAIVKCTFNFHNKGKKKTVLMGFPEVLGYLQSSAISDFTTRINGIEKEAIKVSGDKEGKWDNWFIWDVEFGENEDVVISNTYTTGSYMATQRHIFNYIVETGAGWMDSLQHTEIIVTLKDVLFEDIATITPTNYTLGDSSIHWHFYNFEPTEENNISIKFHAKRNIYGSLHTHYNKLIKADSAYFYEKQNLLDINKLIKERKHEDCIQKVEQFYSTYTIDKAAYPYYLTVKCLIKSYQQMNRTDDAIELIKSSFEILEDPHFDLAKLYEQQKDFERAIVHYKLAKKEFNIDEHRKYLEFEKNFYSEETIENYVIPFLKKDGLNSYCDFKIATLKNK